jgi:hypothetical protein
LLRCTKSMLLCTIRCPQISARPGPARAEVIARKRHFAAFEAILPSAQT